MLMAILLARCTFKHHYRLDTTILMTSSKKGISAHQLHRTLDITYEAAWFMTHRIREAMRTGGLAPMGAHETVTASVFIAHLFLPFSEDSFLVCL